MKKVLMILLTLLMCVSLSACGSKKETTSDIGIPNPVVEYKTLYEINNLVGVNLIKPPVMGVENESYYVINNTIAQYVFELNGKEWTFKAANIKEEDISGIYDKSNVYIAGQNGTVYTDDYYLDRFFDGDRQYTIVVEKPGDLTEETFSNCCLEIESIITSHNDDSLVGEYYDVSSMRATAVVERNGDTYYIMVQWSNSADEMTFWTMEAKKESKRLNYAGEYITRLMYDSEGKETREETASNNLGYFEIDEDGLLYWQGASDESCRSCVFEKAENQ